MDRQHFTRFFSYDLRFLRQLRLKFLVLTWDNCISTLVVNCLCPQRAFAANQHSTVRIKAVVSCLHSLFFFFFNHEWRLSILLKHWLLPEVHCLQKDIRVPGAHSHKTLLSYISRHKLQLSAWEHSFKTLAALVFLLLHSGLFFFQLWLFPPSSSSQAMLSSKLTLSSFH